MIRSCPACGAKNRVPARHLPHSGRCGSCKSALAPLDTPVEVDSAATFDEIVKDSGVPVLVDFWAEWCGPCRAAAPHVKKVAHDLAGRAVVMKVDTERLGALAARYGVRGIPNFVVLRDGHLVKQHAGMVDAGSMASWLQEAARS